MRRDVVDAMHPLYGRRVDGGAGDSEIAWIRRRHKCVPPRGVLTSHAPRRCVVKELKLAGLCVERRAPLLLARARRWSRVRR